MNWNECVCFVRLQQLDQHCQASSQQVLQLLGRQKQLLQERQQLAHDMHNLQAQVSLCYTLYSDLSLLCNFNPDDCLNVSSALPTSRMEALTCLITVMQKILFLLLQNKSWSVYFNSLELYARAVLFWHEFCLKFLVIYPLSVLKLVEKTTQITAWQLKYSMKAIQIVYNQNKIIYIYLGTSWSSLIPILEIIIQFKAKTLFFLLTDFEYQINYFIK